MREGLFEPIENSGKRQVFRLRWLPDQPLSEQERNYAEFVRYLIAAGRLSEATGPVEV